VSLGGMVLIAPATLQRQPLGLVRFVAGSPGLRMLRLLRSGGAILPNARVLPLIRSIVRRLGLVDALGFAGLARIAHRPSSLCGFAPGSTRGAGLSFDVSLLVPPVRPVLIRLDPPPRTARINRESRRKRRLGTTALALPRLYVPET